MGRGKSKRPHGSNPSADNVVSPDMYMSNRERYGKKAILESRFDIITTIVLYI